MGRYLSQRLLQRIKILEQLDIMINSIRTQLEYSNIPLNEMLNKLSANEGIKKLKFIDDCLYKVKQGIAFPKAWKLSIENNYGLSPLNNQDKDILLSLGNVLGTTDLNGQLNICNYYICQINDRQIDARQKYQSYSKLFSAMGILSGATISIIIF